jgi:hypothetical protein
MDYTTGTVKEIPGEGKAIASGATTTISIPWTGSLVTGVKKPAKALGLAAKRVPGPAHDVRGRRLGEVPAAGISVFK